MCITSATAACDPLVNLLTSDIIFNYDMNPYLKRLANDATAGAISENINIAIEKCEHPTLIYCPRLTPEHVPVLLPRILNDEWAAAMAGSAKTYHTDVTELFALVINSGTDRDYNEAATRYRQMFGEEAKNNNAGFFVFKSPLDANGQGSFKPKSGWQDRFRGPAFNFMDAFEKGLVVPLAQDKYVHDWLKFWAKYVNNAIRDNPALFDEAAQHIYVSHSAKICWSLLLTGRQAELIPNANPVALEAEPRDDNAASAVVWKDECIYLCGPVRDTLDEHACNNRVHCEKTCLANTLCKGFYLAEGCIDESKSPPCIKGHISIDLPQDRELANPKGPYYAYMALNRFDSEEGMEFNSKGTFPAREHRVPMYTYTESTANKSALVAGQLLAMNCTIPGDLTNFPTSRDAYAEMESLCANSTANTIHGGNQCTLATVQTTGTCSVPLTEEECESVAAGAVVAKYSSVTSVAGCWMQLNAGNNNYYLYNTASDGTGECGGVYGCCCAAATVPPPLPVHNTLSKCKASGAQVCTVDSDGMVHELRTGEWILNPIREYSIVYHNDAASCKSKCMLDDICMAWTWNAKGCTHHTGIGQITTSSTVADTSVLTDLGFDIAQRCDEADHAFDMCMNRCVHIRNKLHQGWCAHKWVNCKAGPYIFKGIQEQQRGQSMCAGGSHPEAAVLPGEVIARMSGQGGATTYRMYGDVRLNITNADKSDRNAVTFDNAREGAYTANRCGDIGTYDMTPGLFDGWKAWSEQELNTHVKGRMSDISDAEGGSQHSWSTRTFVSAGGGDTVKLNGAAYASPMAGTSSTLADGPTAIRFPKCQVDTTSTTGHLYSYTRGNQCDKTPKATMLDYFAKSTKETQNARMARGPKGSPFVDTRISSAFDGLTAGGIRMRNEKHLICYVKNAAGAYVISDMNGVPDAACDKTNWRPELYDVEYERAYADNEKCYMTPQQMFTYTATSESTETIDYTRLNAHPRGTTCKELETKTTPRHLIVTKEVSECKQFIDTKEACAEALKLLRMCEFWNGACALYGPYTGTDTASPYYPSRNPKGCYIHYNGFFWWGGTNTGDCKSADEYGRCICWSDVPNSAFEVVKYGRWDGVSAFNWDAAGQAAEIAGIYNKMPYSEANLLSESEKDQLWFHDAKKSFEDTEMVPAKESCSFFGLFCSTSKAINGPQPVYSLDSTSYFEQCMDRCKKVCDGQQNRAVCKFCIYGGPDHYLPLEMTGNNPKTSGVDNQVAAQNALFGTPMCVLSSTCTLTATAEAVSGTNMADLVRVTEFPTVSSGGLPESAELTQLVEKGAMLQDSIDAMHPTTGHIQNAQRAFADEGDITQATTYSPAPGDLMLPLTPLKCVRDYTRLFRYPGRISMSIDKLVLYLGATEVDLAMYTIDGSGSASIGTNIWALPYPKPEDCTAGASTWCKDNNSRVCQFVMTRPEAFTVPSSYGFTPPEGWLTCLVFTYPEANIVDAEIFGALFTPGVSIENDKYYQFGCEDESDGLPGAWTGARSLARNAQKKIDGREWLAFIATKSTPGSIGHILPHTAGTGADQNVGNAGLKCPSGVQVGSGGMSGAHWHPLAQTTLMCPHDKPVRCSKLTIVEPVGGTCEYSSETGKQQETWSGTRPVEMSEATYSRENWKSKLGNNAPCHVYDFGCHTIEDDIATSVCGIHGEDDTALGGTKCGEAGGSDGYCGVKATDGSNIPPSSATCGDWPTKDRAVCPSGFALIWNKNSVALCVPAVRAEKRDGRTRKDTHATLAVNTLSIGAEYYQSSNCRGVDEVADNTGKCVPLSCAARNDHDCAAQDLRTGANSCKKGTGPCETDTAGARQADSSLWWPGFNIVAGSFAGVGPGWHGELGACDDTASSCHGFSACGSTFGDHADECLNTIIAKCCNIDHGWLKDIDTCAVEPSAKCGGGMYLHNRPEFLANRIASAATPVVCPTKHPHATQDGLGCCVTADCSYSKWTVSTETAKILDCPAVSDCFKGTLETAKLDCLRRDKCNAFNYDSISSTICFQYCTASIAPTKGSEPRWKMWRNEEAEAPHILPCASEKCATRRCTSGEPAEGGQTCGGTVPCDNPPCIPTCKASSFLYTDSSMCCNNTSV
jgi:hypothetical protein